MLRKLFNFIIERREWRNKYEEEWHGYFTLNEDKLSRLQLECLEAVKNKNIIKSHEITTNPEVPEKIVALESQKPGVVFYVYNGDAYLEGNNEFYHIEECGCISPKEFINEVIIKLEQLSNESKNA